MTANTVSDRLKWRPDGDEFALHYGQRASALLRVVPDRAYSGMYRVQWPDGRLSDMVNLTRAKDAARAHALAILGRKSNPVDFGAGAPPVRSNAPDHTAGHPATTDATGAPVAPVQ